MKPSWRKIILILGTLVMALIVILFVAVIHWLPSPEALAKVFERSKPSSKVASADSFVSQDHLTDLQSEENGFSKDHPHEEIPQEQETIHDDQAKKVEFIKGFMQEELTDIRVCQNLGQTQYFEQKNKKGIGFEEFFGGDQRRDSVAESVRFPMKAILQDENIRPLMQEIFDFRQMGLSKEEKKGFMEKVGFYTRLAAATAQLYQNKSHYEYLANRAVHLGIVAKIAALKPELVSDPAITNFCQDLQGSIQQNQSVDLRAERQEIIKLIEDSGLSYKDLDFDPESFVKFKIESSSNGLSIEMSDRQK